MPGQYSRLFLKDDLKGDAVDQVKALPNRTFPVNVLKQYTGDWLLGPPANKVFSLTVDSGCLTFHTNGAKFPLETKTAHQFYFAADNSVINFD